MLPTFENLTRRQRRLLNRAICERFPGCEPFCSLWYSASQGGILILDIEVAADGRVHRFHALIANNDALPPLRAGFHAASFEERTVHSDIIVLGYDNWDLPTAVVTAARRWLAKFRMT